MLEILFGISVVIEEFIQKRDKYEETRKEIIKTGKADEYWEWFNKSRMYPKK